MGSHRCWNCKTEASPRDRYCSECEVPLTAFSIDDGDGFLSSRSNQYLKAVLDDDIETLRNCGLDSGLEISFREQIHADLRAAYIELGMVAIHDPKLFREAIDSTIVASIETLDEDKIFEAGALPELLFMFFLGLLSHQYSSETIEELGDMFDQPPSKTQC